ncbi:hypothetical protein FS842_000747 [Serendipita sp. 407]|nr:hypothetical protein FS842_000747 [Serendipita sp. 407]
MAVKYHLVSLLSTFVLFCHATSSPVPNSTFTQFTDCTPFERGRGTLAIASVSSDAISLGKPVAVGLMDGKLRGDVSEAQEVLFYTCESSFMQKTSSHNVFYGHISLANDPSKCPVSRPGQETSQDVTLMKCANGDNSLQTLQFWKLILPVRPNDPSSLHFVGHSTRLGDERNYVVTLEDGEGHQRVIVDLVPPTNAVPRFLLLLETHIHQQPILVQDHGLF